MNPQVRTGITHLGTAMGGAVAAVAFLSQHSVDIYALWNQLNAIIAEIAKLIAIATPIVTGAYGIYKSTTTQRLNDMAKDPGIKGVIASPEIAAAVPSDKVVSTAATLPLEAKNA